MPNTEDERTPLLGGQDSHPRQAQSQRRKIQDISPFELQPFRLYEMAGAKDIDALEELGGPGKIMTQLKTDPKQGLPQEETKGERLAQRCRVYGKNALPEKQMKSFWRFLWESFNDQVLLILTVASVISFSLGLYQDYGPHHNPDEPRVQWIEGVSIMVAILIVTLVSSINDYSKEKQFKALNEKHDAAPKVNVRRAGKSHSIESTHLLVGDILEVEAGSILTCDALFLRGHDVSCDETSATGESDAVRKLPFEECKKARAASGHADSDSSPDCFFLAGSKVVQGNCDALVLAVGQDSFQGRLFMDLRAAQPEETKLQRQLGDIAEKIAKYAAVAGGVLFVALMVRFFIELRTVPHRTPAEKAQQFIQSFVICITLIVVAVPEGLPLAVTLALAFATKRMTSNNLLVRVFQSCETMSNATCIVTDKTGTLTQNNMMVVKLWFSGKEYEAPQTTRRNSDSSSDHSAIRGKDTFEQLDKSLKGEARSFLISSIAVNSTAFEDTNENGDKEFVGSSTETALLRLLAHYKWADYSKERDEAKTVRVFPFSSDRKAMGTVVDMDGQPIFLVKGASEALISQCTSQAIPSDGKIETQNLEKDRVGSVLDDFADQSLRTLALCYKKLEAVPEEGDSHAYEKLAKDLTLLAIAGIKDPLRDGVASSVGQCHQAGLDVIMCTGDSLRTAKAIAIECGIAQEGDEFAEASKFRAMSDEEKRELVPNLKVLARSLPQDKADLIEVLHDLDQIVGVTGDGTNDSLALKKADVGFSMGISGTEVAKEASDIVLMDDNFASVVKAIMWGRCVSDAVRKFLQFQLAVNLTAIVITFVSALTSGEENSVLNAVQLLWVNLIMDTFAALALATDPATPALLERKPEPPTAPVISPAMVKMILLQAIYQITITLALHFSGPSHFAWLNNGDLSSKEEFTTLVFNAFVWCQIFNMINCRQLENRLNCFEGLFRNAWLLVILFIMIGGQILIVFFGGVAFGVVPISLSYWMFSITLGSLSIPLGLLIRLLPLDSTIQYLLEEAHVVTKKLELPLHKPSKPKNLDATKALIKRIRRGRARSNKIIYFWRENSPEEERTFIRGLVMLPSTVYNPNRITK